MDSVFIGIVAVIVLVLGGGIIFAYLSMKRDRVADRRMEMEQFARQMDLHFTRLQAVPRGLLQCVPNLSSHGQPLLLFRRNPQARSINYLARSKQSQGPQWMLFDYPLEGTGSGQGPSYSLSDHSKGVTVFAYHDSTFDLPPFALRPQNLDKTNIDDEPGAGRQRIVFLNSDQEPAYPDFHESYFLVRDPETPPATDQLIRDLFDKRLLEFLNDRWALSIEGSQGWLIVYREATIVAANDLVNVWHEGSEIAGLFGSK